MGFAKPPRQVEFCEACFVDWQLRGHHDKIEDVALGHLAAATIGNEHVGSGHSVATAIRWDMLHLANSRPPR